MSFNKKFFTTGGIVASSGDAACSTDSVQPFGADSAFSSNVALYQLDSDGGTTNNVPDTTTNYNGIASNVTYASGHIGNVAVFNGSSSAIVLPNNILSSDFSISTWFNLDDTDGIQTVFEMDYENRILFRAVSTDSNLAYIGNSGYFNHGISFSAGQWYHLVITFSAGNPFKIYVDGVLSYTGGNTSVSAFNNDNILGASNSTGGGGLDGKIDQVRIFDKAISAEDVATLYAETSSTASDTNPLSEGSGVALYSLDYDASEASGYYDGTPTNVEFGVGGQINTGARFNGSSSRIDTNYTLPADSTMSFSFWINAKSIPSNDRYILSDLSSSATDRRLDIRLKGTDSAKLHIDIGNGSSNTTANNTNFIPTLNTWHHIVVTLNGTAINVYVDNASPISITSSVAFGTAGARSLSFGRAGDYNGGYYNGDLDQVRIFSSALTSDQVEDLYEETACVYDCTTDTVNYPTGATPIAYYKLDNSSEDETGSYDGTENNISYTFGRYGQAADFSGSVSLINTGYTRSGNEFAASMWVNAYDTGTRQYLIADFNNGGATASFSFSCFIDTSDNLNIKLGDGSSSHASITTGFLSYYNKWTHIVLSIASDGKTATLYLDNNKIIGATATNSYQTGQNPIGLGHWGGLSTSANEFVGLMDTVRIYSTALTDSQVTELYEEKPCADTSNFKAVLYTGNADTDHYISNVGFQPDLVWVKNRSSSGNNHALHDSVRGVQKQLRSDTTGSENDYTSTNYSLKSYDANGFTVGDTTAGIYNVNGAVGGTYSGNAQFVAWCWKGGGDAVNIGVNSITASTPSIASDVSANTEAGFSIVKYTGNNSVSATVGHGLSDAEMIILKDLTTGTNHWRVWHKDLDANKWLYLSLDIAQVSASTDGGIRYIDSNTFGFINGTTQGVEGVNYTSSQYIAYCWHSVAGYSKIGSYEGQGSGTRVYTTDDGTSTGTGGFKPSFIMLKNADTGGTGFDWYIYDVRRDDLDGDDNLEAFLTANNSTAETISNSGSNGVVMENDGFKLDISATAINGSGDTFIYMAFK